MAGPVFVAVLTAAVLHACWNAIAKLIPDAWVAAGLLSVAGLVGGAVGAVLLPLPDARSWPYIAASSVLQTAYLLLLTHAYRHGEFGRVYPLARGLPPLLVTVVSVGVIGEQLTARQLAGVVIVSLALAGLVFAGGWPQASSGLGLAAATGLVVAGYSVLDGVGARHSGAPVSYTMWLFMLQGALVLAVSWRAFGKGFGPAMRRSARPGLLGGLLAMVAYAIVVWAQTQAPLALVSALRESSLLFAGVVGILVFRERIRSVQLVATATAVVGIAMMQTA